MSLNFLHLIFLNECRVALLSGPPTTSAALSMSRATPLGGGDVTEVGERAVADVDHRGRAELGRLRAGLANQLATSAGGDLLGAAVEG